MSYAAQKAEEARGESGARIDDNKARARLRAHLAHKGYLVEESDSMGPAVVLVVGMDNVQRWRRESKSGKDFNMVLVERRQLSYE